MKNYSLPVVVAAVILVVLLAALAFQQIAWNVGVVGLAAAAGGNVSEIDYGTALGGLVALTWLGSILTPRSVVN